MNSIEEALKLLRDIDKIYERVILGENDLLDELDNLLIKVLDYDDLSKYNQEETEILSMVIDAITDKVNLIYKINKLDNSDELTIEKLRNDFQKLEMRRFDVANNYVMGIIKIEDVDLFREMLFTFRKDLYAIPINDSNLLEIARMKSKIQHFETEILEDEDVLRVAYENSN